MIKSIFRFLTASILLFAISYFSHQYIIDNIVKSTISFSLIKVYLFHLISAIIVYSIVVFVFEKLPNQAGYAYLASIFLKLGFFVMIFQTSVFTNNPLTRTERLSLVIPLFLFLIIEAIGVSKLLNSK